MSHKVICKIDLHKDGLLYCTVLLLLRGIHAESDNSFRVRQSSQKLNSTPRRGSRKNHTSGARPVIYGFRNRKTTAAARVIKRNSQRLLLYHSTISKLVAITETTTHIHVRII